ncbi:MAG: flagellin [Paraglaciecola psychrophila]|jgi:flagellin
MPLVINSNLSSLNSQRQLVKSGMELDAAMERLSSGKRINSAADDAAGLAISNRLTSQVRGLDRAVSNANDGISLIQTAEGALDESTNILQRMRELSIQSANGIYADGDRTTLNAEVQQLVAELDRIAETTSFNGQQLLDGTLGNVDLQIGSEANQIISFSIDAMSADSLGLGSTSSDLSGSSLNGTAAAITLGAGDILINDQAISAFTNTINNGNLTTLIDDINASIDGVTASGFNVVEGATVGSGVTTAGQFTITAEAVDGGAATLYTIGATSSLEELVTAINEKAGGALTAALSDEGKLTLANTNGAALTVADASTNSGIVAATYQGSLSLVSDDGSAVTITKGANGTDAQLSALGFNETAQQGEVLGSTIGSTPQIANLEAGTVTINGVAIAAEAGLPNTGSLQGKVDNINAVTSETGVVASIKAEESFSADVTKAVSTVTLTGAPNMTNIATIAADSELKINGVELTGIAALTAASDVNALAAVINGETANTGVTASVGDSGFLTLTSESPFTFTGDTGGDSADLGTGAPALDATTSATTLAANSGSLKINGTEISNIDLDDLDAAVLDINASSGSTGVLASIDDNGELQFSANSAITFEMGQAAGAASALRLGITFTTDTGSDGALDSVSFDPRIALISTNGNAVSVDVSGTGSARTGLLDLNTDLSSTVTGSALSSISVATSGGAQAAIGSIDSALETIGSTRSELGAISNRLDFTVSNLMNISENTASARSRIVDADFAAETANLSRAQVLQQAASAMLAQANAAPQQVLSLLR